jgi:hypothetical protein
LSFGSFLPWLETPRLKETDPTVFCNFTFLSGGNAKTSPKTFVYGRFYANWFDFTTTVFVFTIQYRILTSYCKAACVASNAKEVYSTILYISIQSISHPCMYCCKCSWLFPGFFFTGRKSEEIFF